MERSYALGGLTIGLLALIVAVSIGVGITAEGSSTPRAAAQPAPTRAAAQPAPTRAAAPPGATRAATPSGASAPQPRSSEPSTAASPAVRYRADDDGDDWGDDDRSARRRSGDDDDSDGDDYEDG